ncbi:6-bladed beta-propeller [Fulvitalea axinellae]|uniref:6-bladed beta-propeller n=1 Tax=Fulvitalea axinellae TaxID=1182444 RepID=UPI0030CA1757
MALSNDTVYVNIDKRDTLFVCNFEKIKDLDEEVRIPLSDLVDKIDFVRLETTEESYLGKWPGFNVTKKYLGARENRATYKLFDRKGKFIKEFGAVGKGPGEYTTLSADKIDDETGDVFLLPWNRKELLRYGKDGKLKNPIPLKYGTVKGSFDIKGDEVSVVTIAFRPENVMAQTFTTSGDSINAMRAGHVATTHGYFSNSLFSFGNTPGVIDFHAWWFHPIRNDSLYHYLPHENRFKPVFTLTFKEKPMIHTYMELPHHFLFSVSTSKQVGKNSFSTVPLGVYMVDKRDLSVKKIKLFNDFFGDADLYPFFCFKNGKFVKNIPAVTLIDDVTKMLEENKKMSKKQRSFLEKFVAETNEDDNPILLIGNLKR